MSNARRALAMLMLLAAALGLAAGPRAAAAAAYLEQRENYSVFIIGDALAGGLWAGIDRASRGDARLRVSGRYKEDSGLARPEIHNWIDALPKILERQEIDIAIIMLGSNDGQDMRPFADRLAFGEPEWRAAYEAEMGAMLDLLKAQGSAVYWIGLPPMGDPEADRKARIVSEVQEGVLKARGIKLIDLRPPFSASDGSYSATGLTVDGQVMRLRERNGVNFMKVGNDKLAKVVLDVVRADIASAVPPGTLSAAEEPGQAPAGQQSALPMFGQGLSSGEAMTLQAETLPPVGTVGVNRSGDGPLARQVTDGVRSDRLPVNSAAALYGRGQWPTVKPGRIDDF
ncbi:MAG: DUF459 domain-containing protein, partial [Parvibaculaceae bacterium]